MLDLNTNLSLGTLPVYHGGFQKRFTDFTAAGGQYISIPSITLSGDFEIEGQFETTTVFTDQAIVGGTLLSENTVVIDINGANLIRAFAYVGTTLQSIISTSATPYQDGELHTYKLVGVSNAIEFFIDGVSVGTTTWALSGSQDIKYIGLRGGSDFYWNGNQANLKIWTGGDRATGTLARYYPINESGVDNIVVNKAAVLGSELVPLGNLSGFSDTTANASHTDTSFTTTVGGVGVTKSLLIIGKTYLVDVSGSGGVGFSINTADLEVSPTSRVELLSGYGSVAFTATQPVLYLRHGSASTSTISNISVREAPGYGTRVNLTSADVETYFLNLNTTPDQWESFDSANVLPVAGTP